MEYRGKLYGRLGGKMYFDTGKTSDDWDALEKRVAELEAENQSLRQLNISGINGISKEQVTELYTKLGSAYNLLQDRLDKAIELDVDESDIKKGNNLIEEVETLYKAIIPPKTKAKTHRAKK